MVLGSGSRSYCKKDRVLKFLVNIFGSVASAPLRLMTNLHLKTPLTKEQ